MQLSLDFDSYECYWTVRLQGSSSEDSYLGGLGFLEKLIKHLKQLPTGDPMNDHMSVTVDLTEKVVRFASCSFYGTPAEIAEQMRTEREQLTISEFLLVPREDLRKWVTTKCVQEYRSKHFPQPQILSATECRKRVPWMKLNSEEEREGILFHEIQLPHGEELTDSRVNFERRRNRGFFCRLLNSDGRLLAHADADHWVSTKDFEHESWDEILQQTTYLSITSADGEKYVLCAIRRS